MRRRGINFFVGVHRSPINSDIAMMVGAQTLSQKISQKSKSQTSVQFEDKPSVSFSGNEPDAIRAAAAFVKQHYNFSTRDVAKAVAITGRETVLVPDEVSGSTLSVTRFNDARGGYVQYNPTPVGELKKFTAGTISIYQPNYSDLKNPPIVGIYG